MREEEEVEEDDDDDEGTTASTGKSQFNMLVNVVSISCIDLYHNNGVICETNSTFI